MTTKEEHLLQKLVENCRAAIFMKDQQGRFLFVNDEMARIFGANKEEIIGKTDYDFQPKALCDSFRENDRKVTESGQAISFKEEVEQQGTTHIYLSHKFPIKDLSEHPNAVAAISIDITTL